MPGNQPPFTVPSARRNRTEGQEASGLGPGRPGEELLKQHCSATAFCDKPGTGASGVHRFVPESQGDPIHPVCPRAFSLFACNSFFNQVPGKTEAAKAHVQVKLAIPGTIPAPPVLPKSVPTHLLVTMNQAARASQRCGLAHGDAEGQPYRGGGVRPEAERTLQGGEAGGTLGTQPTHEVREAFEPAALPLAVPANHAPLSRFTDEIIQHVHRKPEAKL